MRILVTGCEGQLGRCLVDAIGDSAHDELAGSFGRAALDVSDAVQVRSIFDRVPGPVDVLVNAAAFTAVDRCEREPERAHAVNAQAPGLLAAACRERGVTFVHVSTDYVFDGCARVPYDETAAIAPASEYGRSKAEGERRVRAALPDALIVRTSWVFGPGRNFVRAILDQAALRARGEVDGPLRVVDDQRGAPTYAGDLADGILALLRVVSSGVYHLTNAGETTWWAFAREILAQSGHGDLEIDAITTESLGLPAPRPVYSVLDCRRAEALGVRLRGWREALSAYLESLTSDPIRGEVA